MEQSKVDLLNALSPNQLGETIAVAQPDTALLIRLWERLDAEGRELLIKVALMMSVVSCSSEPA